jgi:hypothetical protein
MHPKKQMRIPFMNVVKLCGKWGLCTLALGMLGGAPAHADEVFSNFGVGNTYQSLIGWTIGSSTNQVIGGMFTPTQNYMLTSFDVAAFHFSGLNSYVFSIFVDKGGLPSGAAVVSPFSSSIIGGGAHINSFAATGSLLAGNKYWLVMERGAPDTHGAWNWNNIGHNGFAFRDNGGGWANSSQSASAFRINGTLSSASNLTPEMPASAQAISILLAVGAVALYKRCKGASVGG